MSDHFNDEPDAYGAKYEAQKLAFGPIMFQAVRVARDNGLLAALDAGGETGRDRSDLASATGLGPYQLRVLLEACLACRVALHIDGRWRLGKIGYYLLHDELTRVNCDFVHDVCYQGLFHLDEAIAEGRPAGLQEFGDWPTIYRALAELPEPVRRSWFAFDHYYSDSAFPAALDHLFAECPAHLLDIGGNTGRFAIACLERNDELRVTIADLPGQLDVARERVDAAGHGARLATHPVDLLAESDGLPTACDAAWMSQFLCCFAEDEIVTILRRVDAALKPGSSVFILDTFWDRQRYEPGAYALIATSLYFTCLANGNSRMYRHDDLTACIERAGLRVAEEWDGLGVGHTLLRCVHGTADDQR